MPSRSRGTYLRHSLFSCGLLDGSFPVSNCGLFSLVCPQGFCNIEPLVTWSKTADRLKKAAEAKAKAEANASLAATPPAAGPAALAAVGIGIAAGTAEPACQAELVAIRLLPADDAFVPCLNLVVAFFTKVRLEAMHPSTAALPKGSVNHFQCAGSSFSLPSEKFHGSCTTTFAFTKALLKCAQIHLRELAAAFSFEQLDIGALKV
jgi:hypothetical protein